MFGLVLVVIPIVRVMSIMVIITKYACYRSANVPLCFAQKLLLGVSGTLLLEDLHGIRKYL